MVGQSNSYFTTGCEVQNWDDQNVLGSLKFFIVINVVANHENDTCFQVGLVMGIADCIFNTDLDKIP